MRRYLIGKVAQAFLTLLFVLVFNFFLFRVMPGDPAAILLRGSAAFNPEASQPGTTWVWTSLCHSSSVVNYVGDTLTLNFGTSFFQSGQPVTDVIAGKVWPTILLVGTATIGRP